MLWPKTISQSMIRCDLSATIPSIDIADAAVVRQIGLSNAIYKAFFEMPTWNWIGWRGHPGRSALPPKATELLHSTKRRDVSRHSGFEGRRA